jgi:hypothetical protein
MSFRAASAIRRAGDGLFTIDVPGGWRQGPGAYGGLVLAPLVRAALETEAGPTGEERPLRSLSAILAGPLLTGPASIRTERLRVGKGVSVLAVRLERPVEGTAGASGSPAGAGELVAHAVCVLGRARPGDLDRVDLASPVAEVAPWQTIEPIPPGVPGMPEFTQHFEFRTVDGRPLSGSLRGKVLGWIRLREAVTPDAALVVALADAWWPVELTRITAPRLLVTLSFVLQIFVDPVQLDGAPLLYVSRSLASQAGYLTEQRELWTEAGALVALNQQTFAVVK